jgi:ribose transport system permease protein
MTPANELRTVSTTIDVEDVSAALASAPHTRERAGGRRGVDSEGYHSLTRSLAYLFPLRYRVVWFAVAGLLILTALTGGAVFNHASLSLVTALTGVLIIASLGELQVIMLGGIDLSVPAVMTLAAAIIVKETNAHNSELFVAMVEAIVAGGVIGFINGSLVAGVRLNAMIVTLAVNGTVLGALTWWTGTSFSVSGQVPPALSSFATGGPSWISSIFIVAVGLVIVMALVLRRTRHGRRVIAAGANPRAARVIGIRVRWFQVEAYVLAGVLYAVAGILIAGFLGTPDNTVGSSYQLETISAVAIGGAALGGGPSSVLCTAAGAFFLVTLNQYLDIKGASGGVAVLLQGLVMVIAVAMVTGVRAGQWSKTIKQIPWLTPRNEKGPA